MLMRLLAQRLRLRALQQLRRSGCSHLGGGADERVAAVSVGLAGATGGARVQSLFGAMSDFPKLAALSFMVFNLFIPPCMVAIAVTFREMGSQKWGWFAVGFQLFVGYVLALNAYRLGVLFAGGGFGFWTAVAILIDAFCLWAVFRPGRKAER